MTHELNAKVKKPAVMVVDDQASVCREVTEYLKWDCDVSAFKSGADALKNLRNYTPDLVILDYYMPEMTGFETLMAIRGNRTTSKTPVIFLTTEINERMQQEMLERGAQGYLTKPVDSATLRDSVKKYLAVEF